MTTRYEGVFLELLQCGTVSEILQTLHAHIEQVDQGMLKALTDDDRFDDFYAELLRGVLAAKADKTSSDSRGDEPAI